MTDETPDPRRSPAPTEIIAPVETVVPGSADAQPDLSATRRRLPWILGGSALAVLLVGGAIAVPLVIAQQRHAAAEARYSAASNDYDAALAEALDAGDALRSAQASALESHAIASEVLAAADPAYVDTGALQTLADTTLALTEALEVSDAAPEEPHPLGTAPDDTDELERRAEEIAGQVGDVRATADALVDLASGVDAATAPVDAAGEAFMASLAGSAASIDTVFISATNVARIAYIDATDAMPDAEWADGAAELVARYVTAAAGLAASHDAEEAEKAGPLYANRRAAEDFARSIAGGVMLDFDWAPIVNGYGANGSYGGTATWNTAYGGYSTITLSDSVAAMWHTNPAVASLVAHEVGHSITGKCITLFQEGFGSQAEVFATAWAIGMGYDRDGSGESIYGRPGDDLIELSKKCR